MECGSWTFIISFIFFCLKFVLFYKKKYETYIQTSVNKRNDKVSNSVLVKKSEKIQSRTLNYNCSFLCSYLYIGHVYIDILTLHIHNIATNTNYTILYIISLLTGNFYVQFPYSTFSLCLFIFYSLVFSLCLSLLQFLQLPS